MIKAEDLSEGYLAIALVIITLTVISAIRAKRRRERPATGGGWPRSFSQAQRDAALASQWETILRLQATTPGASLVSVSVAYQPARRGTKAVIMWLDTGREQDSWFAGNWPETGDFALVQGTTGWGPHNDNPAVFYIGPHQVLGMLPRGTVDAVERHQRRQAARNPDRP